MTTLLLSLPKEIIRAIFEYAINEYNTETAEIYTHICLQIRHLFKTIVKDQIDRFISNPILFKLYTEKFFTHFGDDCFLASYIEFNYSKSNEFLALQAINFMKRCLINEHIDMNLSVYSHRLLERIVYSGPKKFQNVTGLHFDNAIGPVIIEVFARRCDDISAMAAVMFFKKSEWIYQFMIFDVIHWMNTRRIPESNIERNKLTNLIYTARCRVFLFAYQGVLLVVMTLITGYLLIVSGYLIGPFLLFVTFLAHSVLLVLARNSEFVINSTPLNEAVLEAKAKEIDYLSDNDEDD